MFSAFCWQPAFFMTEQKTILNNFYSEDKKQEKPMIDEHAQEQMGILIMDSLYYTLPVIITIWRSGQFYKITGIVNKVDYLMKYIIFESDSNNRINIGDITNVERD
ncbi:hypothetical protein J2S17_002865 [Cytobacillus purgationiresistens]|uniref:YolD-like protein n=2 Tax=Cytobacillus purgationiresistens TaxID=863449 RepID=A0ABU0AJD0_9BACI|nr:hypothetical protein [Cytobacillus purgationiresistens]